MKNIKWKIVTIFLFTLLFSNFPRSLAAESSYVLPYPSAMPGSKIYKANLLWEQISRYWYFGNFGQFRYNFKFSDKYLVEAKTLFEYKQYLLAYKALKKSDNYFQNINQNLINAQKENKNIVQEQKLLKEGALKHIDELSLIKKRTPENFTWRPEKSAPTILNIHDEINNSIEVRKKVL